MQSQKLVKAGHFLNSNTSGSYSIICFLLAAMYIINMPKQKIINKQSKGPNKNQNPLVSNIQEGIEQVYLNLNYSAQEFDNHTHQTGLSPGK